MPICAALSSYQIEQVIEELDRKKKEALQTTYDKVNKDFGSIFSTFPSFSCPSSSSSRCFNVIRL
jgi:hypothetical protein